MGTNYYRIPLASEIESRKQKLIEEVTKLELTPSNIERNFSFSKNDSWESSSIWDDFLDGTNIHLGKRSSGWKFCWNFHKNKHYSNKEELLSFIRSGRVVDEYGQEWDVEEFIIMALEWGQPDSVTYYVAVPGDANKTGYHMARVTPIEVLVTPQPGIDSQIHNVIDQRVQYDFPTASIEVNVPQLSVQEGTLVNIPVKVFTNNEELGSLQFGLKYNDTLLEFKGVHASESAGKWLTYVNPENNLMVLMSTNNLRTIRFIM